LENILKLFSSYVQFMNPDRVFSADETLSVFSYLFIKTKPKFLCSIINFIKLFFLPFDFDFKQKFIFETVEIAISIVFKMDSKG